MSQDLLTSQGLDLNLLRKHAARSLYFFARGILGYDWLTPHIHGPICAELERSENNRLLIELPRGWLKTTLCTVAYSIWMSVYDPNIRILITQNSHANACKKLTIIRAQWEKNPLLRALYPHLLPTASSVWKADSACLTRTAMFAESTYEAAGTSTRVTSRHYDIVIEDDTVAPDLDELGNESLAPTHDEVQKAIGWHRTNVLPLLNNPSKDRVLVVGTRWYDQDLIRYIKDNEPQYKILSRAVREDGDGRPDPQGMITYPERFDGAVLRELEAGLGPYMYNCLYMNTPVRSEDMTFRPGWFKYYETLPPTQRLAVYTTYDTAGDPAQAVSKDTDYSVVLTAAKDLTTGYIYVLDYTRKRCGPGELASMIFDHVLRYHPILVGYQDIVFERSAIYWLRELMRQNRTYFTLEPLKFPNRKDAKNTRIASLQPLFANELIFIRPHHKELMDELVRFPLGSHDDVADTLSMQLLLWKKTRSIKDIQLDRSAVDGFALDTALAEIRGRQSKLLTSSVFDPSRTTRELVYN